MAFLILDPPRSQEIEMGELGQAHSQEVCALRLPAGRTALRSHSRVGLDKHWAARRC